MVWPWSEPGTSRLVARRDYYYYYIDVVIVVVVVIIIIIIIACSIVGTIIDKITIAVYKYSSYYYMAY